MLYTRLTRTVSDKGILIPSTDSVYKYIKDVEVDHYASIFQYNEEQYKKFQETGSVSGIKDVSCSKLIWDFDSHSDLEDARSDAKKLIERLNEYGVPNDTIRTWFSGKKGFTVQVNLADKTLSPEQFRNLNKTLAEDLDTNDLSITNASRILRVPGTKHPVSGKYKIPITLEQLNSAPIAEIEEIAKDRKNVNPALFKYQDLVFPDTLEPLVFIKPKSSVVVPIIKPLDYSKKPKFLSNCRWSLQNGRFLEGSRNTAFTCLGATYRHLGFELDHTYRILKGVAELQAKYSNTTRFSDEELYNSCLNVYSPKWNGGIYTCREPGWLQDYCESLKHNKCKHQEDTILSDLTNLSGTFTRFATNLESNIIKTGIKPFDDRVTLTTSMLVGLLGAPSAGKTQTSFTIMNNASKAGLKTIFFSMDMGLPLVYVRLLQKHTGYDQKTIYDIYKKGGEEADKLNKILEEEYGNVKFCFQSGLNIDDMQSSITDYQNHTGEKVKLIVVDYLECISGPYADATANIGLIAQQLKDLANREEALVLLLLQTQKMSGDPSSPLLSMRNIKGSSAVEQSASVIISIYREGFSAKTGNDTDRFITINAVKNRMGPLTSIDCGFEGLTGTISYPLSDEDYAMLKDIRAHKELEKKETSGW